MWFRFLQSDLTQKKGAEILDCCHFVRWCLLDSVDGVGELACSLQDAIGSCYDWGRNRMALIAERVCDMLTPPVLHDDTNAMVVSGGMGEVP
jgi:hypothetical protein